MAKLEQQQDFQQRIGQIEGLIQQVDSSADPAIRASAKMLVQALLDLYGAGLERMLDITYQVSENGQAVIDELGQDELVSNLLLLHGLHPLSLETRILQALEKVRPYLGSHGGNVQLVGVDEDGVVRLQLQGSCDGCPSSEMTLKLAIEEAIQEVAPDITSLVVEGVVERPTIQASNFIPISQLRGRSNDTPPPTKTAPWETIGDLSSLTEGTLRTVKVADFSMVCCRVNGTVYAYLNKCPGCRQTLENALLTRTELTCPGCELSYDVIRAGRCLGQPSLNLEPFPLLEEQGQIKVALPALRL